MKIALAFDGGNRDGVGTGFGSYAIVKGNQRTVTRLEFGGGMSVQEAAYDTLIMGLKALMRSETPSDIQLEVQTPHQWIINQIKGTTDNLDVRMHSRREQLAGLIQQFATFSLVRITPERMAWMLKS